MKRLLREIRSCDTCSGFFTHKPRPVLSIDSRSKILIIGQAPGRKVHLSGIPWDDRSGAVLRDWLGVDAATFYDVKNFAIVPMGFCYPGRGASGDLPPRPECAKRWHPVVFPELKKIELTILVGWYAQKYYLGNKIRSTLTETVRSFETYLPEFFPVVHPSPRNGIWLRKNQWFEKEVVPALRLKVHAILERSAVSPADQRIK